MIIVDAHVHIYECFNLKIFFDSAYSNIKNQAIRSGHGNNFTGVLFLAETASTNWFYHLANYEADKRRAGKKSLGIWKFTRTDEANSLHVSAGNNQSLFLVAGRQLVTAEGLELLALGTTDSFEEAVPIEQLIENVRNSGAISVIPWGFGKWIGQRGTVLNKLLESAKSHDFFLGDSSNRPVFMPYPAQFELAQFKNIRNLPGSDPLPFQFEQNKPGSFGFSILEPLKGSTPSTSIKTILEKTNSELRPYGKPIGVIDFFKHQFNLQLNKLHRKKCQE